MSNNYHVLVTATFTDEQAAQIITAIRDRIYTLREYIRKNDMEEDEANLMIERCEKIQELLLNADISIGGN